MQKIRNTFHMPLSLTRVLVGSGIALFLAGMVLLQQSGTAANSSVARFLFVWAGWILTSGWILKRADDHQWPFSPQSRGRGALTCLFALCLGAFIWRSYGPALSEPQVTSVSQHGEEASVSSLPTSRFQPASASFLSLVNTPQPVSFRPQGSRFRFSSQAMAAPPALSGKLPSSWDIQP